MHIQQRRVSYFQKHDVLVVIVVYMHVAVGDFGIRRARKRISAAPLA